MTITTTDKARDKKTDGTKHESLLNNPNLKATPHSHSCASYTITEN